MTPSRPRVLVTGATGYIGGRLVPSLLEAGYPVRCLARSTRKLAARRWASDPSVEMLEVDLNDVESTAAAARGCGPAYYLVHSMVSTGSGYAAADRAMARTFAQAAERAGISRIIYLGGLGEIGAGLSDHLSSRREVEAMLASGSVPVTVFRAGMVIGAGSASFEILRYLVERLPVMVTPKWVTTESQPIAVGNVLAYLVDCLRVPETVGETLDIGGPDIVSYQSLMQIMAEERGLPRRLVIPVPVLTPRLSSLWIQLVTPLSHRIARPLAEGLRNRIVCRNDDAARLMPQRLYGVREAIRLALRQVEQHEVETAWSDAGPIAGDPDWAGGTVFVDQRQIEVSASPSVVFRALSGLGGPHGWYGADWLWRLRGALDRLVGGPGLRRGRRDPDRLAFGEALDFWRVTAVETDRRLALRAEMKLPGEALLEFTIEPLAGETSRCRLVQTARFLPRGLLGLAYRYAVMPLHGIVFGRMLRGIRRVAEALATVDGGVDVDPSGRPHSAIMRRR
ncbi:MAG TPA: SDR family oxidoreductase [Candidatus Bathyarchaeia archaeon]|nr:SDR family oxidoreductase [Candidatus Bathyarchaeia archaeon]